MLIRKKSKQIWTIISVFSLGIYTTACDSGAFSGDEEPPANIDLRFAVSISDVPSTRANYSPGVMQGADFANGTHTFGMFITDDTGASLVTGSDDNMKSILTRNGGTDAWSYTDNNDLPLSLKAKQGQTINITGYYPWVSDATTSAVPFDLTGDITTWKDLLYLSSPTGALQVADGNPIALTFSHAFCWVTIKLSKLTSRSNVYVKSVSLDNRYSGMQDRIVNKGDIDPATGDLVSGTSGPLVINCTDIENLPTNGSGTPFEFNFLVPSFMYPDVDDSDVLVRITTTSQDGTAPVEVLSFPFNKTHLNGTGSNLHGFEKGKHNTYNIVYNNAEMVLSLSNWQEVAIEELKLGEGTAGVRPYEVAYTNDHNSATGGKTPAKLLKGNHINHTYLGEVAESNNGKYIVITSDVNDSFKEWGPFLITEPFYPNLKVSRSLAAGGAPVPWKDEKTGALTAKQACVEFREGGYKDWRLPRISELFMLTYNSASSGDFGTKEHWSATEYDEEKSHSIHFIRKVVFPTQTFKSLSLYVRCVRDSDKPKPTI
ncbi:fimbrillin family protein [Parabacteroides segnis]|uniref:fimbrillin family protein n=1 Tax=Parabacteroides segnis TaxID=2763058 RepID=UPI0035126454